MKIEDLNIFINLKFFIYDAFLMAALETEKHKSTYKPSAALCFFVASNKFFT